MPFVGLNRTSGRSGPGPGEAGEATAGQPAAGDEEFAVYGDAAYGAGELHALSPGPFILSYGVVEPNQTIDVVIRWDHRITDAALIAKTLTRLEQVLNTEIAGEIRSQRQQTEPKPVRAVAT